MDPDQESLLTSAERTPPFRFTNSGGNSRFRRNAVLMMISIFITICLVVYFYLNMQAIEYSNQESDQARFKPLSRRKPMLDHESIFSESGPSLIRLSDLLAHCIVALRIAGHEVVRSSLVNNENIDQIRSKGKTLEGVDDIVTGADMRSHKIIVGTIKDSYRRLLVVSEEDTSSTFDGISVEDNLMPIKRDEFARLLRNELREIEEHHVDWGSLISQQETLVWIDPLDATKEYSENLTSYVTLMACIVHQAKPLAGVVYKPFTGQMYWSIMDTPSGKYHHSSDLSKALDESKSLRKSSKKDLLRVIVSRSHAGDVKNALKRSHGDNVDIISAGGSGYKTIELLKGQANAYVHLTHIKKWDICAPNAIVNSLNGRFTDLYGKTIDYGDKKAKIVTRGLAVSLDPKIHQNIVLNFEKHNQ